MSNTTSSALGDLAQRYWNFIRAERPISALIAGQPCGDELIKDAPEDFERRAPLIEAFLAELAAIDEKALDARDRATWLLMRHELVLARDLVAAQAHLRPSLYPLGPDFILGVVANLVQVQSVADADAWFKRLLSVNSALDGIQRCLKAGVDAGIRLPRVMIEATLRNVRGMLSIDPARHPLHGPLARAPKSPPFEPLVQRSLDIVRDVVYPALAAYADFIEAVLLPAAQESVACTDSPQGREFYALLIRQFATVDDTPEAIHATGLSEVDRLNAEMAAVAASAGFPNDLEGFRQSLKLPDQFSSSGASLREEIEVLSKRIDSKLPAFFGNLPRMTYGVESIPEAVAEGMPPAYALPNPADKSGPGTHWITSLPTKCPRYMHLPLALHEAWPGHLMHLALIQEQDHLPAFRRHGALGYSACLEGWALYCERLGEELGLYDTPQKRYGAIEMEMWRAVRLVVDTGLHAKGWSRQQAIDFAMANLAMPETTLVAEVDRYIGMPAQALAYQLGNLKFRQLRREAEHRLGDDFRVRDFHDALMACGPVTLPILESLMHDWISRTAQGNLQATPSAR